MRQFLLADNALGFVPLVSAYLFWQRSHMTSNPEKRDLLLDVFFFAPRAVATVFILYVVPSQLSWYYWLNRVDLWRSRSGCWRAPSSSWGISRY